MRKRALSILLALLLALTACNTSASTPEAQAAGSASIQSLALEPGADTAQVGLAVAEESALLVAVYDADSRMVSLGGRRVVPGESPVSVPLSAPAPQRFRAKAFLMNDSQAPTCESFLLDRSAEAPAPPTPDTPGSKTLVAYFSATGKTRPLAQYAAEHLNADLFEIVPQEPYTEADLAYYTDCRADREQNDPAARPAIAADCKVANMADYDTVILGYPIWHGQAPKIIYTFLESYNFTGKTIVPFCTSASNPMGSSAANLQPLSPGATWLEGRRFAAGTTKDTLSAWLDTLELPQEEEPNMIQITLAFNGHTYPATLADNSSAQAFAELLKSGPLTVHTSDYGNFEKVGDLGTSLPRNDEQITTVPGDIILYEGDKITVYYAKNSWTFTRLGRIDDPTGLRDALGDGDVDITFQLAP